MRVRPTVLLPAAFVFACGGESTSEPPVPQPPAQNTPSQITIVEGNQQRAFPGATLEDSIVARVTTNAGMAVSGVAITWSVSSGGGTVSGSTQTRADGTAHAAWTLGSATGEQRVSASAAGVAQAATFTAEVLELRLIDVHTHLHPGGGGLAAAVETFAQTASNAEWYVFMPPPMPPDHPSPYDVQQLASVLQAHAAQVILFAGGGTLNAMIHEAAAAGGVSAELRARFDSTANALLAQGARGFGEIALTHLSAFDGHPYESVPGDHELLLRLADIAAQHDVPLDLHLDIVTSNRPLPPALESPPNPGTLVENRAAFERLLAHNRDVVFIWGHAGSDLTGQRSVALMRELLRAHANLYISLELGRQPPPVVPTSPLDADGRLRAEWVALISEFSDRFVLGSDHFYQDPASTLALTPTFAATAALPRQLPIDVALKVSAENARRILGIP